MDDFRLWQTQIYLHSHIWFNIVRQGSHWDEIGIGILPRICPQDPDNNLPVHLPLSWASLMLRLSFIALRRTEYWWSSVSTPLWSFWVSSITLNREVRIYIFSEVPNAAQWVLNQSSPLPDHRGILPTEMPSDTAGTTGTPGNGRVLKVQSFLSHLLQHVGGQEECND